MAQELKKEGIKVNAVTPGITSTKLNGFIPGGKTAKEGAEVLLPWALLGPDGKTGMFAHIRLAQRLEPFIGVFFDDAGEAPW